tara:strand:+ start:348 stop:1679 length:1332 start_codon:yes stop_codon:yes gene_type:complete
MPIYVNSSTPALVESAMVISNSTQKEVELAYGTYNLKYYESILQDTVQASFTFIDAGTMGTDGGKGAVDEVPITGSEVFHLKFSDNQGNTLKFEGDNSLYVNDVTPLLDETTKSLTQLHLVSKEYILNEKVRINSRMDGSISQHIETILTEEKYLNTKKDVHVEETVGEINENPKNKKPFYIMNELSKRGVSATNQEEGKSAGYFLYETFEGFNFKSIDGLLNQDKKLSVIFNESTGQDAIPTGYDVKAVQYSRNNLNNVQKKLAIGAYTSRVLTFNPFNFEFNVGNPSAFMFENDYKMAGDRLPVLNEEFNNDKAKGDFSVTSLQILGVGGMQIGDTETQLTKSKNIDFNVQQILNQSFMRYNNLFASQVTITIPGDFSLHAGDAIFVDAPTVDVDVKNDDLNRESGGLYIIADLAHYLDSTATFTKLNLVRDSFGRKGNHS